MAMWIHKRGLQEPGGNGKVGKGFRTKVEFELGFEMAFVEQEGHQGALKGGGW